MKKLSRREFLATLAGLGAAAVLGGCGKTNGTSVTALPSRTSKLTSGVLSIASGDDPSAITKAAIAAIGGMDKLVRAGDFVVIKPNMAWSRPADVGATTNPKVIAALIEMCKKAGAKRILVLDHLLDSPAEATMAICGIMAAGQAAGAEVRAAQNESEFRSIQIPKGVMLKSDTCIKDILEADVFINVPIAKSHSATKLSLGMKNLMGCNWDRQSWHTKPSLDQCIADYLSAIKPDLTVLDANRILLTNGPKGPGETKDPKQVIVSTDAVAIDAYGATLFGMKPSEIEYVKLAAGMGLGEMDLSKVKTIKA